MNKIKINYINFFTVALSVCLSQPLMAGNSDLTQYVRPNIGTVHSRCFFILLLHFLLVWQIWERQQTELTEMNRDGRLWDMMMLTLQLTDFLVCMNFRLVEFC